MTGCAIKEGSATATGAWGGAGAGGPKWVRVATKPAAGARARAASPVAGAVPVVPAVPAPAPSPGAVPEAPALAVRVRPAADRAAPARPAARPAVRPAETVLPPFVLAGNGAYGARLAVAATEGGEGARFVERWTLDGPEPYAVPLPTGQPEEAEAQVLPLADGRVLVRRRVAERHTFSLLYPTGPGTGEVLLGAVERDALTLLPPSPDGVSAYALSAGAYSTGLWRVAGGPGGPEHLVDLPGRCSGGVWLDRAGRLLALDREPAGGGPVKTVAVDLERGAGMTPLLQIAPESDDRLLLADPDSGLLLIRSDAPGHDRLGWGVLGSSLPVRFPECLRLPECAVTPFAVQPGQSLMPESCAVALRIDGAEGTWIGLWRPSGRRLHQVAAPAGWLGGSGVWSPDGVLKLPYAEGGTGCAVALLGMPEETEPGGRESERQPSGAPVPLPACTPVPLGQAPLVGRPSPEPGPGLT